MPTEISAEQIAKLEKQHKLSQKRIAEQRIKEMEFHESKAREAGRSTIGAPSTTYWNDRCIADMSREELLIVAVEMSAEMYKMYASYNAFRANPPEGMPAVRRRQN